MNKNKVILPFRYPGGKYYAIKKLKKFWESVEHDEYREPFLGGGAVFWAKPKVKYNWINDKHEELINVLNHFKNPEQREGLIALFKSENEADKIKYEKVREMNPKSDFERAYKYYYLNRTSYSGKMKSPSWGYRPKRSLPPYRWHERIIPCGEKIAENVKITSIDFEEVINAKAEGKNVLIFLDPPYFKANQENHYVCSFNKEDHLRLKEVLKKTEHNFFLTYDDCQEIRDLYSWANIYEIDFFYRLDNSNDNEKKRKKGNEIVITNFEIEGGHNEKS